jgi:hypothetical protein
VRQFSARPFVETKSKASFKELRSLDLSAWQSSPKRGG